MAKPTVNVFCKLPLGLMIHVGKVSVTLKGTQQAERERTLVNGFAVTPGVDAAFYAAWVELHKHGEDKTLIFTPLERGLIFASVSAKDGAVEAKEKRAEKTGLEPMNRDKPAEGIKPSKYEGMQDPDPEVGSED